MELDLYTGELEYRGILFTFVFDKMELRLIPPKDKRSEIFRTWLWTKVNDQLQNKFINESFLKGRINETAEEIVFITEADAALSSYNSILIVPILGYAKCNFDGDGYIDRINFSGPELNCIHPIVDSFSYVYDDLQKDGIVSITTNSFKETTTEFQTFSLDGKTIKAYFSVSRNISKSVGKPPLELSSSLNFEFKPTDDYWFIYKLWSVAKRFIQYLCYSRSISFSKVELLEPCGDGIHKSCGELYIIDDMSNSDLKSLKKGHYIKQVYINSYEGNILQDISDSNLYMEHIPNTFMEIYHKNPASYVLIMAAFERELGRVFPELNKYRRKGKKNTLKIKIINACNAMSTIMDAFGKKLYSFSGEKFDYTEIGERLAKQRNNFSHGNITASFEEMSIVDLVFIEYMVYGMQLKYYGLSEKNIQKSINELFQRGVKIV